MKTETEITEEQGIIITHGFFTDCQIANIMNYPSGEKYILFWQKLLILAKMEQTPGIIQINRQSHDMVIKNLSRITQTKIEVVIFGLQLFDEMKMIKKNREVIEINNFERWCE